MLLSEACCAAPLQKLCPEYSADAMLQSFSQQCSVLMTDFLVKCLPLLLNSGASGDCESSVTSLQRACTEHSELFTAASIISTA